MIEMILGLSPVILGVNALLIGFSIVSWTIMISKTMQIKKVKRATKGFLDFFWETKEFSQIHRGLEPHKASPLSVIFQAGYRETEHFLESAQKAQETRILTTDLNPLENISRSLRKISSVEIEKLEKDTSFLATTASATPFIGLFGTVWGIMYAFTGIGAAGSTSLAIVAPGISEALATTAIGLAVAIPAVIGYNYLQGLIKTQVSEIDNFSYDFLNIVQKLLGGNR